MRHQFDGGRYRLRYDLRLGSGERTGQELYTFGRVHTDPQRDPVGQAVQPGATRSRGPHWIGDEQIGESRIGENLGLTHRRHCQADGTERQLTASDLQTLVGFGVWT